jgi:hypothetical protein
MMVLATMRGILSGLDHPQDSTAMAMCARGMASSRTLISDPAIIEWRLISWSLSFILYGQTSESAVGDKGDFDSFGASLWGEELIGQFDQLAVVHTTGASKHQTGGLVVGADEFGQVVTRDTPEQGTWLKIPFEWYNFLNFSLISIFFSDINCKTQHRFIQIRGVRFALRFIIENFLWHDYAIGFEKTECFNKTALLAFYFLQVIPDSSVNFF